MVFTVLGDGFLYNMVRIIAGTLMEVGTGKRAPGCIARAISTRTACSWDRPRLPADWR